MKYIPLLVLLLSAIAFVLSFIQPGSGWGVAAVAGLIFSGLWLCITRARTGSWLSDSAAGH